MTQEEQPRVVVVTGSAGGIGVEIQRAFESLGDIVVGVDIEHGFDIRDESQCQDLADTISTTHGRADVLCNNAGTGAVGDILTTSLADWQRVMDVNVLGTANMSRALLPLMRSRASGVIVNTCSVAADVGFTQRVAYSASKGAVLAMTRAMAADEVVHGIRVNCVSPATVDGPWVKRLIDASPDPDVARRQLILRQPLGRLVDARDVAAAIVYLADSRTTTTGCELRLDGGVTGVVLTGPA